MSAPTVSTATSDGEIHATPSTGYGYKEKPLFSTSDQNTDPSSAEIYKWIREGIQDCRGTELQGTLNPDVLPTLFHKQAGNLERLSTDHLNLITAALSTTFADDRYNMHGLVHKGKSSAVDPPS